VWLYSQQRVKKFRTQHKMAQRMLQLCRFDLYRTTPPLPMKDSFKVTLFHKQHLHPQQDQIGRKQKDRSIWAKCTHYNRREVCGLLFRNKLHKKENSSPSSSRYPLLCCTLCYLLVSPPPPLFFLLCLVGHICVKGLLAEWKRRAVQGHAAPLVGSSCQQSKHA
jgi:hypothetical protein